MSSALKPAIGSSGGGQTSSGGGGTPVTGTNKGLSQPMQHGVPPSGHSTTAAHMQQQVYAAAQAAHTSTMQNIMSAHQQHGHPALGANMSMAHQHQQAMTAHQQSLQSMQQGLSNMTSLHYSKQVNHNSNMVNMSPVNMVQERTLSISQQQIHMAQTQQPSIQPLIPHTQLLSATVNPTSSLVSSQNQSQQTNSGQQSQVSSQNSNQNQQTPAQNQIQQSTPTITVNRVEKSDQSLTAAVAPTIVCVTPSQPKTQANGTIESSAAPGVGSTTTEVSGIDVDNVESKNEQSSGPSVQEVKQPQTSPPETVNASQTTNLSDNKPVEIVSNVQSSIQKSTNIPQIVVTTNTVQNTEPTSTNETSQQIQNSVTASTNQTSNPSLTMQAQTPTNPNVVHDSTQKTPPKSTSTLKLATTPRMTNKRKRESVSKSPKSDKSESPAKLAKTDSSVRIAKVMSTPAKNQFSDQEDNDKKGSKRVRVRTQPYQSPLPELALITKLSVNQTKQSPASDERLIAFYKNEFIAVRNAEGSFYICQAVQNVYKSSSRIRIRWLSNHDKSTDVYSPDFYDYTDFDCILTNLNLERIDKGKYRLPKNELERTENILKRAIDVEKGVSTGLSFTEEHPDGLDLSLFRDESQLKKRRASKLKSANRNRKRKSSHTTNSGEDSKSHSDSGTAKKTKSSKRRLSRNSRSKKISPVKSKPPSPIKKVIKTITSAVKKDIVKSSTAAKKNPANVQTLSGKKNNSVAVGRAERAAKRSGDLSPEPTQTSPVVDTKKARVLAKVARKPVANANTSTTKSSSKPAPVPSKNSKSARPANRGTRSSGVPVVAITTMPMSSRRQAASAKKSTRK